LTRVVEVEARVRGSEIVCEMPVEEIIERVMVGRQIVILKRAYLDCTLTAVRASVNGWGQRTPPVEVDDFLGNYHRRRVMISRLQQAPHVFHDYNFNNINTLEEDVKVHLKTLFEPLRQLYKDLSGNDTQFEAPKSGPYVHPQIIHYPSGGGFFARHWHNLLPQKLGFIVALSKRGRDYRNGGTCFEIDGDIADIEMRHDVGDICVWRYDLHHWVTQSDLQDKFDWDSESGRWVATYAYFDPLG
jgi:hypothetical protein